ncbi:MAG: transcription termination/antitermination protein NusA [Chloroflexi bacterium]|nr:MAG: transcription termination/antitermination protein NusA [Chloroflexota bacterium]
MRRRSRSRWPTWKQPVLRSTCDGLDPLATLKSDFIKALDQIQDEKGISKQSLLNLVESALATAYRRAFNPAEPIRVHVDQDTAHIEIFGRRKAVESVSDPAIEVALEEARRVRPQASPGDLVEIPIPTDDFARLAAQISKQVVFQRLRDAEKDQVLRDVLEHRGELVSGVVDRVLERPAGRMVYLELGKAEGVLPPEEQIPEEAIRPGQHLKVLLLDERRRSKGAQVLVTRAHKALVRRLLEFEIPELSSGAVVIRALAREPGVRSKVAVEARQEGIDPVGACVGPKGVRIRSVVGELASERVDIIPWAEDPAQLVANALSPAQVDRVEIDRESRTATAHVPDGQLSLAIGKDGQNARLAAKLTGWRIDIKPTADLPAEVPAAKTT